VKARELRELTIDELRAKAQELRREHFGAKVRHSTGQLENTAKLRVVRRDIARVESVLHQKMERLRPGAGASR
jgi:large subunit ribosomal protein L29